MKKYKRYLVLFVSLFIILLSSCSKGKIDSPTNLAIDENNILQWDKITNAKTYEIKFLYIDNGTESSTVTRKTSTDLSDLAEGDYEISVKALSGNKDYKDSVYSEAISFHKYYETGCVYTLINNKTEYEVTRVGKASGTFVIEGEYRGKAVTSVAQNAFKGSSKVESIVIGENIITIGDNAFYNCSKLNNIVLPTTLSSIGSACFQSCRSLQKIEIPNQLEYISDFAFAYCRALTEVKIGDKIKSIGEGSFMACSSIKELVLPDSIETIGSDAFSSCDSLESVQFGQNTKTIKSNAFIKCTSLKEIKFKDNSVETIENYAFSECSALNDVVLPIGIKEINDYAFSNCSSLSSIVIPETCSKVGTNAFLMSKLYIEGFLEGGIIYADKWAIGCTSEFIVEKTTLTSDLFKEGTIGIADSSFVNRDFEIVNLSNSSIKYIGNRAFLSCSKLWKFLCTDVESIGDYAFAYCGIININLGSKLKSIGNYTFMENASLNNSITDEYGLIPSSVESIGAYAFYNTKLWTNPRNGDTIVYAGNWVVGCNGPTLGKVTLSFDPNSKYAGIADYAFKDQKEITEIEGLSGCRYIGEGAFLNCESLMNVVLNQNLTKIEDYTFLNCKSLLNVRFPYVLKSIGNNAFYNCESLTEMDFENTLCEKIGDYAFFSCDHISMVLFSDKTTSIGNNAFNNCSALQQIVLPEGLTYLGEKAFYKCYSLGNVTLGSKLEIINDYCFANCKMLTKIEIPDTVKVIKKSSFYNCEGITSLSLGNSVEVIGDYAFYGLSNLSELTIPSSVKEIGKFAFKGLTNISIIIIPETIDVMSQHAFYGCTNATFFTTALENKGEWHQRFNSSRRPMFYGVTFDDMGRVSTLKISSDCLLYRNSGNIKMMDGFKYFIDESNNQYSIDDLVTLNEYIILTVVYE